MPIRNALGRSSGGIKRSASLYVSTSKSSTNDENRPPGADSGDHPSNKLLKLSNRHHQSQTSNDCKKQVLTANSSLLNLSISDCTCPICLEILVEPVQMPCHHEVCLPCFKAMTDKTNFLCPMCRMRISTWSRNASNSNSLVNQVRWAQIQRAFPREISDRVEGKTAAILAESIRREKEDNTIIGREFKAAASSSSHAVTTAEPGAIRQEYEDYLRREQERIRLEKEQEEKLSLELIQRVIREEEAISFDDYMRVMNMNRPGISNEIVRNNLLTGNIHNQQQLQRQSIIQQPPPQPPSQQAQAHPQSTTIPSRFVSNSSLAPPPVPPRPTASTSTAATIINTTITSTTATTSNSALETATPMQTNTLRRPLARSSSRTIASVASFAAAVETPEVTNSIKLRLRPSIKRTREQIGPILVNLQAATSATAPSSSAAVATQSNNSVENLNDSTFATAVPTSNDMAHTILTRSKTKMNASLLNNSAESETSQLMTTGETPKTLPRRRDSIRRRMNNI